jgi:hypothetical protein
MGNKETIVFLYLTFTSPRNEECETDIMGKDFGGSDPFSV